MYVSLNSPPTQYLKISSDFSAVTNPLSAVPGFDLNTFNPGANSFLYLYTTIAPGNNTIRTYRLSVINDFGSGPSVDILHSSTIDTTRSSYIYRDGNSAIVSYKQTANSPFVEPFTFESKDDGISWASFPAPNRYKGYYVRGNETSLMDKDCIYTSAKIVCLTNIEFILDNLAPGSITPSPILVKSKYENGSWNEWTTAKIRIK